MTTVVKRVPPRALRSARTFDHEETRKQQYRSVHPRLFTHRHGTEKKGGLSRRGGRAAAVPIKPLSNTSLAVILHKLAHFPDDSKTSGSTPTPERRNTLCASASRSCDPQNTQHTIRPQRTHTKPHARPTAGGGRPKTDNRRIQGQGKDPNIWHTAPSISTSYTRRELFLEEAHIYISANASPPLCRKSAHCTSRRTTNALTCVSVDGSGTKSETALAA